MDAHPGPHIPTLYRLRPLACARQSFTAPRKLSGPELLGEMRNILQRFEDAPAPTRDAVLLALEEAGVVL